MKLTILNKSINETTIPYADQMRTLLKEGPVAIIKSDTEEDIAFFGHEGADQLVFCSISITSWRSVETKSDCDCEYCTDFDGSSNSESCHSAVEILESAEFEEISRVTSDGASFVTIAQGMRERFPYDCAVDFVMGMKSELGQGVVGYPLSGSILTDYMDEEITGLLDWAAK